MFRQSLILLSFTFATICADEAPNLVPEEKASAANYWCTWYAQNYWIQRGGEITNFKAINNSNAREELTYHNLFNPEDGWASTYLPRGRGDYIFLIDHGWQDKDDQIRLPGSTPFFSLQMDYRDFPQFQSTSYGESLRLFNEQIKAAGWRNLGLWTRGEITEEAARRMVEWSRQAGIQYWKIDGGGTDHFYSYHIKEEIYPELVLEYITGSNGPLNPGWNDSEARTIPSVYAPGGPKAEAALKVIRNTDVFRTYDAAPLLVTTTTLRRIHDILSQTQGNPEYIAKLNIQDDTQVAAGLGCLVAVKRHPNYLERTLNGKDLHHQISGKRMIQHRMNEVERFGRWSRIAPPFPAGQGSYQSSTEDLIDSYPHDQSHTWYSAVYGKTVYQSAPAIMARNMPLPVVEAGGESPYVMATTYPNGPLCVATEGRVKPTDQWYEPRAHITVQVKDANQVIGIFGHYESLTLKFAGPLAGLQKVWAQDLLSQEAVDIFSRVGIDQNSLTIPGDLIDQIGTSAGDKGDISVPGMVIRLEGNSLPIAGDDYAPKPNPVSSTTDKQAPSKGLSTTAIVREVPYGSQVSGPKNQSAIKLTPLKKGIEHGKFSVTWNMKPADQNRTQNGFIVLSSDPVGDNAVIAGSWIGSNEITIFEQSAVWGNGPKKKFQPGEELACRVEVDMDARTLKLTINGTSMSQSFSEAVTSINYLGFGVKGSTTLFTEPRLE